MFCALTPEQQGKLITYVASNIFDVVKSNGTFDLAGFTKKLYDTVLKKQQNGDLALHYAKMVPGIVADTLTFDMNAMSYFGKQGFDFNQVFQLAISFNDEEKGLDNVKEYLGLQISEDAQQALEAEIKQAEQEAAKELAASEPAPKKVKESLSISQEKTEVTDEEKVLREEWKKELTPYSVETIKKMLSKVEPGDTFGRDTVVMTLLMSGRKSNVARNIIGKITESGYVTKANLLEAIYDIYGENIGDSYATMIESEELSSNIDPEKGFEEKIIQEINFKYEEKIAALQGEKATSVAAPEEKVSRPLKAEDTSLGKLAQAFPGDLQKALNNAFEKLGLLLSTETTTTPLRTNEINKFLKQGINPDAVVVNEEGGPVDMNTLLDAVKNELSGTHALQLKQTGLYKAEPKEKEVIPVSTPVGNTTVVQNATVFRAHKPTAFATRDWEAIEMKDVNSPNYNKRNPAAAPYFDILRNILDVVSNTQNASENAIIGNQKGIKLMAVRTTSLDASDLRPGTVLADNDEGVVLVVSDAQGNPIRFNLDTREPAADGKIVYFNMRKTYADKNGKVGLYGKSKDDVTNDYESAKALKRNNPGMTLAQAEAIIQEELNEIHAVREYLKKNPTAKLPMNIIGGSKGYVKKGREFTHRLETLPKNEVTSITVAISDNDYLGVRSGFTYITTKNLGSDNQLVLERTPAKDVQGLVDFIADLLTEVVYVKESDGSSRIMTAQEKSSYISQFFMMGRERGFNLFTDTAKGKEYSYSVYINNENILSYNIGPKTKQETINSFKEKKEEAKAKIKAYFSSLQPLPIEKPEELPEERKRLAKTDLENAVPGDLYLKDGKYYNISFPPVNVNRDIVSKGVEDAVYDKVTLTPVEGGLAAQVEKSQPGAYYTEFVAPNMILPYELNGENKVQPLHAYLAFEPAQETIDALKPQEEKKTEVTPVEKLPENKTTSTNTTSAIDLLIEGFDKRLDQKSKNKKYTEQELAEKIKEAEKWWSNNPLSKVIPFKTMFDAVNTANPKSVASWTALGITLFKGSDLTDLYHEAWHAFSQTFMTPQERDALYKETRGLSGSFVDYKGHRVVFSKATDKQVEEYLAEEFRSFMLGERKPSTKTPVKKSLFERIWEVLKAFFSGTDLKESISDDKVNGKINELFDKLRVGNIKEYSFKAENAQFGYLESQGMVARNQEQDVPALSVEDSYEIASAIDALFSQILDEITEKKRAKGATGTRWATSLIKDPNALKLIYTAVKQKFENEIIPNLTLRYEDPSTKDEERVAIRKKLDMYDWTVNNFGNLETLTANRPDEDGVIKDVIGYHMAKSNLIDEDVKEMFFDEEVTSEDELFIKGREGYDKSGNETSLKDLAAKEILFILKGLQVNDAQGNPVFLEGTEYVVDGVKKGVPKLVNFDSIWNVLVKTLENTQDATIMYAKLEELQKRRPDLPIKQLLEKKLGPVYVPSQSLEKGRQEFHIWTNFWQTFNKSRVPLLQTTVEIERLKNDVQITRTKYVVKPGKATGMNRKIERVWNNLLATSNSPYVIKNNKGLRYLNIGKILNDFPKEKVNQPAYKLDFLAAIGFAFDGDPKMILKELNDPYQTNLQYIWEALNNLNKRHDKNGNTTIYLTKIDQLFKKYPAIPAGESYFYKNQKWVPTQYALPAMTGLNTLYNELLDIQARHSEKMGNFMVTNAEGNVQFEHTLNNSLTVLINTVNEVNSYQELIQKPWMRHLDINVNPQAKASLWLKSLFFMDPNSANFGQKRSKNKINIENLSGIAVKVDGEFDDDASIASASADANSKLLMDIHNLVLKGTPELMRHADKGTSFTIFLDTLINPSSKGSLYLNTTKFLKAKETGAKSEAEQNVVDEIFLPNVQAELDRILKARKILDELKNDKTKDYIVDHSYLNRAKGFVLFSKVLSTETKKLLLSTPDLNLMEAKAQGKNQNVYNAVKTDILKYFDDQIQKVSEMLSSTTDSSGEWAFSDNLYDSIHSKNQMDKLSKVKLPSTLNYEAKQAIREAVVKSFVYNSWIHNMESLNFVYGDIAQYKLHKEEFHKRNAGASSGGTIYRTDAAAQQYINEVLGRGFEEKKNPDKARRQYNGTLNTAVGKDSEIPSVYFKEYAKALIDDMMKKDSSLSFQEAEEIVLGVKKDKNGKVIQKGTYEKPLKGTPLSAYAKMTEGDGQGWITFDAYRILKTLEGTWTDNQEALYQKMLNDQPIELSEVLNTFPPQKLQYWGPVEAEDKSNPFFATTAFHKFSVFPLVPTVIKNTNLAAVNDKLLSEGIDYMLFESGSKVGTLTKKDGIDDVYENMEDRSLSSKAFVKNVIHVNFLKNQLEIAPKFKNKVIFSTQLRKLIEDGLVENGVPVDFHPEKTPSERMTLWNKAPVETPKFKLYKQYENLVKAISDVKRKELLEEMAWQEDASGNLSGSLENLVKFVKKELSRQDLAEHELSFIDLGKNGKALAHDLSLSLSADKIERVLNSILVKRLVKMKVNGEGLIQVSGALFENTSAWTDRKNATKEQLEKWGTNDLPTYHKKADGKTAAMKVKIAMQGKFKLLLELPDVVQKAREENVDRIAALNLLLKDESWLDKDENRKLITMVGVRIPVQGLNSMEFMEVYEFLPMEAGNIIVPPAEIVAKSGSDFDVDKLTVMMPTIAKYGKEIKLVKHDSSIKQSKQELYNELTEAKFLKASIEEMYEEFSKDTEAFKQLTPAEQAALNKLKETYDKEIQQLKEQIKPLNSEWRSLVKTEGRTFYYSERFKALDEALTKLLAQKDELVRQKKEAIKISNQAFYQARQQELKGRKQEDLSRINNTIQSLQMKIDSLGTAGLENDIISVMTEILSMPDNFVNLITPNSTDVVQPMAQELEKYVSEFNPKERLEKKPDWKTLEFLGEDIEQEEKGEDWNVISGSTVLEIPYNMYKHQSNNIGKAVLGMGAVDNTFNIIFNMVGASLNGTFYVGDDKKTPLKQVLRMPHNKIGDNISLSHIYDQENKNKIGDIISRLMNGWVDVAKDAWVFNVQGNKELAPVLLFLVQAGVPFETAALFVSQPIIRDYVKVLRNSSGAFSYATETNREGQNDHKHAVRKILSDPKYYKGGFGSKMSITGDTIQSILSEKASGLKLLEELTDQALKVVGKDNLFTPAFLKGELEKQKKSGKDYTYDMNQTAVFLHFLEIMNMTAAVRDIKVNVNFDTKKTSTVYESMSKINKLRSISYNPRLTALDTGKGLTRSIMEDTVISSFYVQPLQVALFEPLFKLRNNSALLSELDGIDYKAVKATFGKKELFGNNYRNDFASYLFQNALKYFEPDDITSYKGYFKGKPDVKKEVLRLGAFFTEDGRLILDNDYLRLQFDGNFYADQKAMNSLGVETVPKGTFKHFKEYAHFVVEREYLRRTLSAQDIRESIEYDIYKGQLLNAVGKADNMSDEEYSKMIDDRAYETYLKNKALENIWNSEFLFKGDNTFADKVMKIQNETSLEERYPVLGILASSTKIQGKTNYTNLMIQKTLETAEEIDQYYSNIKELADPTVVKVPDPAYNKFISETFAKLPIVAFLQSGMNAKGQFSLVRLVSQMPVTQIFESYLPNEEISLIDKLNTQLRNPDFIRTYTQKFVAENNKSKASLRNRHKDYTVWEFDILKEITEAKSKAKNLINNEYSIQPENVGYALSDKITNFGGNLLTANSSINPFTQIFTVTENFTENEVFELLERLMEDKDTKKVLYPIGKFKGLLGSPHMAALFMANYSRLLKNAREQKMQEAIAQKKTLEEVSRKEKVQFLNDAFDALNEQVKETGKALTLIELNPEKSTYKMNVKGLSQKEIEMVIVNNPDKMFVYPASFAKKESLSSLKGSRAFGAFTEYGNLIPIKAAKRFSDFTKGFTITDENNQEVIAEMEKSIALINSAIEEGKQIVFLDEGYGQELNGVYKKDDVIKGEVPTAQKTFVYLSEQLLSFGYINPGSQFIKESRQKIQETQEASDSMVEEFIKQCKSKK